MIGGGHAPQTQQVPQQRGGETTDEAGQFAGKILGNTEDVWKQVFPKQAGREYSPPKLILFSAGTRSRCGGASSAMGPFYCPLDQTVYLDLSFFQQMQRQFRAAAPKGGGRNGGKSTFSPGRVDGGLPHARVVRTAGALVHDWDEGRRDPPM